MVTAECIAVVRQSPDLSESEDRNVFVLHITFNFSQTALIPELPMQEAAFKTTLECAPPSSLTLTC